MMKIGVLSHPEFVHACMRRTALSQFLAQLPVEIEMRNEIAARYDALSRLTNEELTAIGRGDVPRVAVLGADG
jgi:hypothetical protein